MSVWVLALFACLFLEVLAFFALVVLALARGVLRWGWQFDELAQQHQRVVETAEASVGAAREANDALERRTPAFRSQQYLTALRRTMREKLSTEEVQDLCFDLTLDYENLPGTTTPGKVRELIELLKRQNRVSELVTLLARERPDVDWARLGDT